MTTSSTPVRLDSEITTSARQSASAMSRSVAEQISHWARLGRELERSPDISLTRIHKVLSGASQYDALSTEEQAVVRTQWVERMEMLRSQLRLDRDYKSRQYRYAELDERGKVVVVGRSEINATQKRTTKSVTRLKAGALSRTSNKVSRPKRKRA